MKIEAIGNYIVVENIVETQTVSGIDLGVNDTKHLRTQKAEVVTSGLLVTSVNDKDVIYYSTSRAFTILIDGIKQTVIKDTDVVIVCHPDDDELE